MSEIIEEIFTDQIDDPANAMRGEINRDGLFELADDIKQNGLINPIMVRPRFRHSEKCVYKEGEKMPSCEGICFGRFEVVAGHRRLGAHRIAGIIKIKCVVRELSDEQAFAIMTAENLAREDVPLLDECRHYKTAMERFGKSIKEIAGAARRSVGYIESRLAIAEMPDYMQNYLQSGELKLGAALMLVQITDDITRRLWVDMAVRDGVSVAQAEYWLHGWKVNQLPGGTHSIIPPGDFVPGAAPIMLFECAIDGKKYDARLFKTVMIYEGNLSIFQSIVSELNKISAPISTPPAENDAGARR